jgi:hypothetical protein
VSASNQRLCLWLGMLMMPLFFLGFWVLAGFVPPPSPHDSAEQIARVYAGNRTGIRIGMFVSTVAGALLCFLFAVIATQLKRIEGRHSPLTYVQLIAGACTVLEFIFPPLFWQNAAFRAERAAATVQTLNDLAWLPFLGITGTLIAQQIVIAIAILRGPRTDPVLPRMCLIAYSMLHAIKQQEREEAKPPGRDSFNAEITALAGEVAELRAELRATRPVRGV